jgi:epsilon-lactone hydrolase
MMPSLQGRLFCLFLRNRHLLKFHLKREAWTFDTSVPQFRQDCERFAKMMADLPEGIEILPVSIESLPAGLSAEWILPRQAAPFTPDKDRVIFYVHGGGYISGSCNDHRMHVARLVQASGVGALLFEYRLAPEQPYPAAVEDILTAYHWLLAQGVSSSRVVIAGESAGGGLALSTLLVLRDRDIPLPAAGVALSPLTDFTFSGESHRTKTKVCLSPPGMNAVCGKYYFGENDPHDPYISPLFGDPGGFPPLFICVGDDETLRDDSTRFAAKAKAAGVDVTLKVQKGMVHCYPLLPDFIPEAVQAMDEICTFIKVHVNKEVDTPILPTSVYSG